MKTQQQHTISQSISWRGIGVHTGEECLVTVEPSSFGSGVVWKSVSDDSVLIVSELSSVVATDRSTDVGRDGIVIRTVEHLLSALAALQITDVMIMVDGPEVPLMDGGSATFHKDLSEIICPTGLDRQLWRPTERIEYRDQDTGAHYIVDPAEQLELVVELDYASMDDIMAHGRYDSTMDYAEEISPARTFVQSHEVPVLISRGLIRGGDLTSALVIYTEETDDDLFVEALRLAGRSDAGDILMQIKGRNLMKYENEPARHKILDLYGDLYLLNIGICARIVAHRPGHRSNVAFAKEIQKIISDGQKA